MRDDRLQRVYYWTDGGILLRVPACEERRKDRGDIAIQ